MRNQVTRAKSRIRDAAYKRATRAFFGGHGGNANNPYHPGCQHLSFDAFEDRMWDLMRARNAAGDICAFARELYR